MEKLNVMSSIEKGVRECILSLSVLTKIDVQTCILYPKNYGKLFHTQTLQPSGQLHGKFP